MTADLFALSKATARAAFSEEHYKTLPPVLEGIAELFESTHTFYCWLIRDLTLFKKREQLLKENKGDSYCVGAALHLGSKYSNAMHLMLKMVLIADCIDKLILTYVDLYTIQENLKHQFKNTYPSYSYQPWIKGPHDLRLCPSTYTYLEQRICQLKRKMIVIIYCLAHLLKKTFELSMQHRDLYLIIQDNTQAKLRACTEIATGILNYQEQLNDPAFLKEQIMKRRLRIDPILKKIDNNNSCDTFLEYLTSLIAPSAGQVIKESFKCRTIQPMCITRKEDGVNPFAPPPTTLFQAFDSLYSLVIPSEGTTA